MAKILVDMAGVIRLQLTESNEGGKKHLIARGEFGRADVPTQNKRVYPRKVWEREIQKINQAMVEGKVLGELDHPADGKTSLKRVSHIMTGLHMQDDGVIIGEAKILDNEFGRQLRSILEAGGAVGVSSRGLGSTSMGESGDEVVGDDYQYMTHDFVADPAVLTSYPKFQTEVKWIDKDKALVEKVDEKKVEKVEDIMAKANQKLREDVKNEVEKEYKAELEKREAAWKAEFEKKQKEMEEKLAAATKDAKELEKATEPKTDEVKPNIVPTLEVTAEAKEEELPAEAPKDEVPAEEPKADEPVEEPKELTAKDKLKQIVKELKALENSEVPEEMEKAEQIHAEIDRLFDEVVAQAQPEEMPELEEMARAVTDAVAKAFAAGQSKKVGNTSTDGKTFFLHGNAIVKRGEDGMNKDAIMISLSGWPTVTTRERINGVLQALGVDARVSQKGGKQILVVGKNEPIEMAAEGPDSWYIVGKHKEIETEAKEDKCFVIDEKTKKVLFKGTKKQCEHKLTYFLNHDFDAYLSDSADGYEEDQFTFSGKEEQLESKIEEIGAVANRLAAALWLERAVADAKDEELKRIVGRPVCESVEKAKQLLGEAKLRCRKRREENREKAMELKLNESKFVSRITELEKHNKELEASLKEATALAREMGIKLYVEERVRGDANAQKIRALCEGCSDRKQIDDVITRHREQPVVSEDFAGVRRRFAKVARTELVETHVKESGVGKTRITAQTGVEEELKDLFPGATLDEITTLM